MYVNPKSTNYQWPVRQRGQALIYGLFVLAVGFVALFFLFNTAQLSSEKTKLVNTADAVAYSAGVMHARALNFAAYTNRALMANEVLIAQMVSVSSWIDYAQGHVRGVPPLNCTYPPYSIPAALALVEYLPLCVALSWPPGAVAVNYAKQGVDMVSPIVMSASESAKANLQLAQSTMFAAMLPARSELMQQVADANYQNDGSVEVDPLPLIDDFLMHEGGSFITRFSSQDRTRFRQAELTAANLDEFVPNRSWSSKSPWPCLPVPPRGDAIRTGGTQLIGFDEWRANDEASLTVESLHIKLLSIKCETDAYYDLGSGNRSARKNQGSWNYSGVPSFFEINKKAQDRVPEDGDYGPTLRFAVRLVREKEQVRNSGGRSAIKPTGKLSIFEGKEAGGEMAAIATSEVYFDRPEKRTDSRQELPSLFNPYWQVHLVANPPAVLAAAIARQSGSSH
ncbi:Tad domain-containing protein [Massilia sp. UMI-21]|nr:Tad domain-containing protein [Massilia sp. UMI-21]